MNPTQRREIACVGRTASFVFKFLAIGGQIVKLFRPVLGLNILSRGGSHRLSTFSVNENCAAPRNISVCKKWHKRLPVENATRLCAGEFYDSGNHIKIIDELVALRILWEFLDLLAEAEPLSNPHMGNSCPRGRDCRR